MKKVFMFLSMLFALSANAQVVISPSTSSICSGQSVTAIATATGFGSDTLNFQWLQNGVGFGMPNNDSITYIPAVGSWNITVNITTPGGQFVGTGFAVLTVNTNPTITATNTGPYCVGGTIQLNAGGRNIYAWTGPSGFSSSLQNPINPAQTANAGTYAVTVTDGNGCSATTTTQVVVNNLPTPNITVSPNDTVCEGTTVALFATGGVSYVWSNAATTANITTTPSVGNTTFTVQATDANGCSATANQLIVVRPNPVVTATGTNTSCFGSNNGSATVTANIGEPFTYVWNTLATTQTINGLTPSIYSVVVSNSFGCTASDTATVSQPLTPINISLINTDVSCNGGNDGYIGVNGSGGIGFYTYNWSDGGVGNPRTNLPVGVYTVTVSDANSCSDTATAIIAQPTAITANADSTSVTCFGNSNGTAFISFINGGIAPYSYVWNNGQTGSSVSNLAAGIYTATITDANGCQITAATAVTQPTQVTFTFAQTNVSCNTGNNGSITATATGGTAPYQYRLNNGNWTSSGIFSGLVAGTYTVSARDANGCTAGPTTVNINQPNALQATVGSAPQGCTYLGEAWVIPSGGQGPYSFQWSNSLGTNDSISTVAGTYTVTVTDANSCVVVSTAVIAAPTPVNITGTTNNPTCFGGNNGSINISTTGVTPLTYLWSNGAITEDLTGLSAPSTLTVIVTAGNGCVGNATYTVVNPAPLSVSVNNDTTSCFGTASGSLTALATGGTGSYSFAWSPSGGNASTITGLIAGVYTVTTTDANGCNTVSQGQVFSAPQLVINSISTPIQCAGSNTGAIDITVTGGTGIIQYWWNGPNGFTQISGDILGLSAGSYSVTATDANGCTTSHTTVVEGANLQTLYANLTAQSSCGNANAGSITAAVSGGTAPYSYAWSNGANSPSISGLAPNTYGVVITDANGCEWQGSQSVQGSPAMIVNLTNQVLCENNNQLVNATFTGGTWPYQFIWTAPQGQTFTSINVNPSQEGIYNLQIIDAFGCTANGTMYVDLIPCATGVDDLREESINVFPNPISFGGNVVITLPNNIDDVTIDVKNITGQSLFQGKTNDVQYTFNTSSLAAGTYLVQIASHDQIVTKRLIVQ